MEAIASVILGVISGLLTPHARRWLRWAFRPSKINQLDMNVEFIEPAQSSTVKEQIRAYNREKLNAVMKFVFLHGFTYFFLFVAIYMPLGWATLSTDGLYFSNTRLAWLCSSCGIGIESQTIFSIAVAGLLYIPIWLFSQIISSPIATVFDHFNKVTPNKYMGILMFVFLGLSLLIAGHWVFLLYTKYSYLQSLGIPFVAIFLGAAIATGNNQRK